LPAEVKKKEIYDGEWHITADVRFSSCFSHA
jgi:hypothetical protein